MVERTIDEDVQSDNKADIDANKDKEKIKIAWHKLFSELLTACKRDASNITEVVYTDYFDAESETDVYSLRIHAPFANEKGQPTDINLSVYHNNLHTQTVTGKAIWNNDTPELIDVNNDQKEFKDRWYDLDGLADEATMILSVEGIVTDNFTGLPKNACFPIPEIYLTSIH